MKKMSSFRLDEVVALRLSSLSADLEISQSDLLSELVNFAFSLSCADYSQSESAVIFETLRRSFSDRTQLNKSKE